MSAGPGRGAVTWSRRVPAPFSRLLSVAVVAAVLSLSTSVIARGQPAARPDASTSNPLPGLDSVLARYVEARGGAQRLRGVEAIRMAGTMTGPLGDEVPTTIYMRRPNRIRQEVEVDGQTLVQAFDGARGWTLNPMTGRRWVEVPRAVARRMAEQADFDGPLVDPAAKGHRIEVVGTGRVGDRPALELRLFRKSGEVQSIWLDLERWLELKTEGTVDQGGHQVRVESRNSDFRTVDGVTLPFVVEVFADGRVQQRIALDRVEFPATLEDRLFEPPGR